MLQEVKQYQCPYNINIIDSGEGEVIRKNRKTKERKYFILETNQMEIYLTISVLKSKE